MAKQQVSGDRDSGGPLYSEFSDVSGWTKPANQPVTIHSTTTITGIYTPGRFFLFFMTCTDKGWPGYETGGWQRGPAMPGVG
jgi:hypothetical protein